MSQGEKGSVEWARNGRFMTGSNSFGAPEARGVTNWDVNAGERPFLSLLH